MRSSTSNVTESLAVSYPTRTSPVVRGKGVLENLLGAPPPPPPADVPELEEGKIGLSGSLRMQLEEHRKNPACSVCHDQMDAIGFGLENYDGAGAWRTHDGKFPIDSSGTLPDGRPVFNLALPEGAVRGVRFHRRLGPIRVRCLVHPHERYPDLSVLPATSTEP